MAWVCYWTLLMVTGWLWRCEPHILRPRGAALCVTLYSPCTALHVFTLPQSIPFTGVNVRDFFFFLVSGSITVSLEALSNPTLQCPSWSPCCCCYGPMFCISNLLYEPLTPSVLVNKRYFWTPGPKFKVQLCCCASFSCTHFQCLDSADPEL